MTKKKKPYQAPADKVEKLTLIGNMGYISANEDRLLAAMWDGGTGGGKKWTPKKYYNPVQDRS